MRIEFMATLALFFVAGTGVALLSRRLYRGGTEEFFVGGYRVGGLLAAMTYAATTYSAFMMVGLVGITFTAGVASLGFELVYLAATATLLSTVGPRVWRLSRERRWLSPSEMIADLYNSRFLEVIIVALYLVALVPYTAAQLKGVGEIFEALGLGYEVGVLFSAVAVSLWTAIAGLWSVATTDAFQGVWMLGSALILLVYVSSYALSTVGYEGISRTISHAGLLRFRWTVAQFVGLSTPWIFFALTNPQVVQRLYIPKDMNAYVKKYKYFSVYGLLYTILCVALGLLFRALAKGLGHNIEAMLLKNRDLVTPYMVTFLTPPWLASTVLVGIVAAAVSTADSIVLSVSSGAVKLLHRACGSSLSKVLLRLLTPSSMMLMLIPASALALFRLAYVVELSVVSSALLIPLAPITIAGLIKGPGPKGGIRPVLSLLLGEAPLIYAIFKHGPAGALSQPLIGSAPAPLIALILSTLPLMTIRRRGHET